MNQPLLLALQRQCGAAHQAGFAARGGVLVDDAPLGCLVYHTGGFGQGFADRFGNACCDSGVNLFHEGLDAALGRLITQLALARADNVFLDGFDIRHGVLLPLMFSRIVDY